MLRNAFDALATEGTLRQLLRQLSFARTATDQLRVNVDNTLNIGSAPVFNGNMNTAMSGAANQPALWGPVSWNSVDARYAYGEQQVLNFIQNRERWSIT